MKVDFVFFFSSRRRHTRCSRDWSSDVCSSDLDEPTASLDPTTQMEILGVFRALRKSLSLTMMFITHNPALLAGFADRILVLYAGRVIELGPAQGVLASPKHPYTRSLFQSIPPLASAPRQAGKKKLPAISGDSFSSSVPREDRKSVVLGKRVDLGGRRIIKKKKKNNLDDAHEFLVVVDFVFVRVDFLGHGIDEMILEIHLLIGLLDLLREVQRSVVDSRCSGA